MPWRPTLTATAREGMMPIQRVTRRRFHGLVRQRIMLHYHIDQYHGLSFFFPEHPQRGGSVNSPFADDLAGQRDGQAGTLASSEQRNGKDVGERLTEVLLDEIVRVKQVTVGST